MRGPILDTTTRRIGALIAAIGVVAAIVVVVVAIAGDGEESSPEEAAGQAVEQFLSSLGSEDYAAACEQLSEEVRAQLQGGQCEQVLAAVVGTTEAGTPDVQFTDIRVSGNQAAVDAVVTADSGESSERSLELVQEDGEWLISSFGG